MKNKLPILILCTLLSACKTDNIKSAQSEPVSAQIYISDDKIEFEITNNTNQDICIYPPYKYMFNLYDEGYLRIELKRDKYFDAYRTALPDRVKPSEVFIFNIIPKVDFIYPFMKPKYFDYTLQVDECGLGNKLEAFDKINRDPEKSKLIRLPKLPEVKKRD